MLSTYRAAFRAPGSVAFCAAAFVGRFSIAVYPIAYQAMGRLAAQIISRKTAPSGSSANASPPAGAITPGRNSSAFPRPINTGSDEITVGEIAEHLGTVSWEVLTNVSRRVPRFYREP